ANIIFEDAPIDQAVEGIISGIYFNQGHVCCAGSRLFVQEGVFASVIRKLRDRIQTLRVGNPLDKNTDIGAINSRMQLDKICEIVNKLRAGVVWANTYNKFDPTSPFGGYKESGFGREGGVQGLSGYLALN